MEMVLWWLSLPVLVLNREKTKGISWALWLRKQRCEQFASIGPAHLTGFLGKPKWSPIPVVSAETSVPSQDLVYFSILSSQSGALKRKILESVF